MALMPGKADLVDGDRWDIHRDAALDCGLTCGALAGAGLQHLAHDHVVDEAGVDARLVSAPLMATPPRSVADWSLSPPRSRPIGVRAPATITLGVPTRSAMVSTILVSPVRRLLTTLPRRARAAEPRRAGAAVENLTPHRVLVRVARSRRAATMDAMLPAELIVGDRPCGHRRPRSRRGDRLLPRSIRLRGRACRRSTRAKGSARR